jgi:hypothetical protein
MKQRNAEIKTLIMSFKTKACPRLALLLGFTGEKKLTGGKITELFSDAQESHNWMHLG